MNVSSGLILVRKVLSIRRLDACAECVEMRFHPLTRGIAAFMLVIPLFLFLFSSSSNGEMEQVPAVRTQLTLDLSGPPDSDPAVLECTIPWESGEPSISRVTCWTPLWNWTAVENWTILNDASRNLSVLSFTIDLEWGCEERVLVSVMDRMGSNSTVGTTVIRSRSPSLELRHLLGDGECPLEGSNHFLMVAEDPDGQELESSWFVDGQMVISESELEVYLSEGDHVICAEVTDGQWIVREELNVTVKAEVPEIQRDGTDLSEVVAGGFLVLSVLCCLTFGVFVAISKFRDRMETEVDNDDNIGGTVDPDDLSCEICMNGIKEAQGRIKCRCGAIMHKGCGRREGVCPQCGREVLI